MFLMGSHVLSPSGQQSDPDSYLNHIQSGEPKSEEINAVLVSDVVDQVADDLVQDVGGGKEEEDVVDR